MSQETENGIPMVTLKTVDRLVGLLVVGIVLFGSYSWWRATRRALARDGMMGQMMGTMPGMDPIWYLFGTLIAVSVVLGTYAISREQLSDMLFTSKRDETTADEQSGFDTSVDRNAGLSDPSVRESGNEFPDTGSTQERPSALTILPEDEQRIIEPILDSPGLTQVELRGRSDFSKAKVSQTVSKLEDRGLIYREKQGRTYRVYPGELLKQRQQS